MKPLHATDIAHAAAIDGHNHGRTRAVELLISERNALIRSVTVTLPEALQKRAPSCTTLLPDAKNLRWAGYEPP